MEILEDKIKDFLRIETGSGYGYGDDYGFDSGNGNGDGDGYGFGSGSGNGNGDGYGSGSGNGHGSGNGSGDGYGSGNGSGLSEGYGFSDGSGYGYCNGSIKKINQYNVYKIDGVSTIVTSIHKNIAKGFILNKDLTLEKCYIAKGQNKFAHGKTMQKAIQSLQEKIFENLDTEEAIEEFRKKFNNTDKYKGTEFYTWHHILTGSCEMGRNNFVKNHDLKLENEFTVKEFINLCKNDFGSEIINELEQYYK